MASWNELLIKAFEETGDDFFKMETTLEYEQLHRDFEPEYYGVPEGEPFTAWGDRYVYFPVQYDGAEWVGYAPRNPCDERTTHWGGG